MAHDWNALFTSLPSDELDKVALLRMIECTNGVIQHLFRDEAEDALSVDRATTFLTPESIDASITF